MPILHGCVGVYVFLARATSAVNSYMVVFFTQTPNMLFSIVRFQQTKMQLRLLILVMVVLDISYVSSFLSLLQTHFITANNFLFLLQCCHIIHSHILCTSLRVLHSKKGIEFSKMFYNTCEDGCVLLPPT